MAEELQIGGDEGFTESPAQKEAREADLAKGTKKSQTEAEKTLEKTLSAADLMDKTKQLQSQVGGLLDTEQPPVIDTNAGDVTAKISGDVTQQEQENKQIEQTLASLMDALQGQDQTQQQGLLGSIGTKITDLLGKREDVRAEQPTQQELLTQTLEQWGVTPETFEKRQKLQGQLVEYQQEINTLEAQKQQEMIRLEGQYAGRLTSAYTAAATQAERLWNSRISAKAAQAGIVEMQYNFNRQNFQDAVGMSQMVVDAALYDQQQQVQDIEWTMNTYKDIYGILDREEEQEWNRTYQLAKDELDQQRSELSNKLNLMTSAAQAGIDLGWDMNYIKSKSLEELTAEASPRIAERARELEGGEAEVGEAPQGLITTPEGDQLNLTTTEGLRVAKSRGYFEDRASAFSWLDLNTKLTQGGIENLLDAAGFAETEGMKYSIMTYSTEAKGALAENINLTEDQFVNILGKQYKDMTDRDKTAAKEMFRTEKNIIQGLGWLAKREYLKDVK